MNDLVQKTTELFDALNSDIQNSILKLNSCNIDEFDFYARAYLRALASWIEGSLWIFKKIISQNEYQWHKNLALEEQLYLFEYDWKIEQDTPIITQKKIRTKDNLRAFIRVAGHLFDQFKPDIKGGWSDLMHFYNLRDRTMHPTSLDSLHIRRKDIEICDRGRKWLHETFITLGKCIYDKTYE